MPERINPVTGAREVQVDGVWMPAGPAPSYSGAVGSAIPGLTAENPLRTTEENPPPAPITAPTQPLSPAQLQETDRLAASQAFAAQTPTTRMAPTGTPVVEEDIVARARGARQIFREFGGGERVLGDYATPARRTGAAGPTATAQVEAPGDVPPEVEATLFAIRERAAQLAVDDGLLKYGHGQEVGAALDALIPTLEGNTQLFEDEVAQHRSEVRAEMESLQGAIRGLERSQIDPNRFYSSNAGMTGVSAAINIGLGAMVSVLAPGTPNYAMQIIESAIDRDIRAQETNMDNRRAGVQARIQFLQHQEQVWGNRRDALLATRAMYLDDASRRVQALASRQQGEQAMMQGAQLATELRQRSLEAQVQLAQSRYTTRVTMTGQVPQAERFAERQRGIMNAFAGIARENEAALGVPGAGSYTPPGATQEPQPSQDTAPAVETPPAASQAPLRGRRRATVARPRPAQPTAPETGATGAPAPSANNQESEAATQALRTVLGPEIVGRVIVDRDASDGQATYYIHPPANGRLQDLDSSQMAQVRASLPGYTAGVSGNEQFITLRPIAETPTRRGIGALAHENYFDTEQRAGEARNAHQLDPVHASLGTVRPTEQYLTASPDRQGQLDEQLNRASVMFGAIEDLRQQIDSAALFNSFGENAGERAIQTGIIASMRSVMTGQGGMTEEDFNRAMSQMMDPSAFTQSDAYARGAARALETFVRRQNHQLFTRYFIREGEGARPVTSERAPAARIHVQETGNQGGTLTTGLGGGTIPSAMGERF